MKSNTLDILPLELIDIICDKIKREILIDIFYTEKSPFFNLNKKKIEKYWKKQGIVQLLKNHDLQGIEYLLSDVSNDSVMTTEPNYIHVKGNLNIIKYLNSILNIYWVFNGKYDRAILWLGSDEYKNMLKKLTEWDFSSTLPSYDYDSFMYACTNGFLPVVKYIAKDKSVVRLNVALIFASFNNQLEITRHLYSLGAEITHENMLCMRMAISKGNLDIVKALTKNIKFCPYKTNNWFTANLKLIVLAFEGGHFDMVKYLIDIVPEKDTFDSGIQKDSWGNLKFLISAVNKCMSLFAKKNSNKKGITEIGEYLTEKKRHYTMIKHSDKVRLESLKLNKH